MRGVVLEGVRLGRGRVGPKVVFTYFVRGKSESREPPGVGFILQFFPRACLGLLAFFLILQVLMKKIS